MTKTTNTHSKTGLRLFLAIVGVCGCAIVTGCGGKAEDTTATPPVSSNAKADEKATPPAPAAKAQSPAEAVK